MENWSAVIAIDISAVYLAYVITSEQFMKVYDSNVQYVSDYLHENMLFGNTWPENINILIKPKYFHSPL